MAKTPATPAKPAPKPKVVATAEFRPTLRERINGLDGQALVRVAKSFGVDIKRYSKLAPGLAKMSISNSILGSAVQQVQKEGKSEKSVLSSIR